MGTVLTITERECSALFRYGKRIETWSWMMIWQRKILRSALFRYGKRIETQEASRSMLSLLFSAVPLWKAG